MNMDDWIEAQKQRLLQNSEANGEFGCLLCKLGGGQTAYSTLTVTFPWSKKKISLTLSTKFVFFEPTWPFYLKFNLSKTMHFLKRP
jgi:hypothetical protein